MIILPIDSVSTSIVFATTAFNLYPIIQIVVAILKREKINALLSHKLLFRDLSC